MFGIEIGANLNSRGFVDGMRNIQRSLSTFGTNAFKNFGAGLVGAFAVGSITAAGKKAIELGGKLADLAKGTKVSTGALQEMSYWAGQNSATLDDVALALRGLGKARDEALGGNMDKIAAFDAVDLDVNALKNQSIEQLFRHIVEKIRTTNFGSDEGVIAEKLMGKGAANLMAAFQESLAEASDEANRLGIILEDKVVQNLDRMGDSVGRITKTLRGPFLQLAGIVAGAVEPSVERFTKFIRLAQLAPGLMKGSTRKETLRQMGEVLYPVPRPGEKDFIGPMPERTKGQLTRTPVDADKELLQEASKILQLKERILQLDRQGMSTDEKRASLEKEQLIRQARLAALKAQRALGVLGGNVQESDVLAAQADLLETQNELKATRRSSGTFTPNVNEWQRIGAMAIANTGQLRNPASEAAKASAKTLTEIKTVLHQSKTTLERINANIGNSGLA